MYVRTVTPSGGSNGTVIVFGACVGAGVVGENVGFFDGDLVGAAVVGDEVGPFVGGVVGC